MTLYRRIKDYCDRRGHNHYHLEKIAYEEPQITEEDLRGEDREVIRMNVEYQSSHNKLENTEKDTLMENSPLGIGAMTKEDLKRYLNETNNR